MPKKKRTKTTVEKLVPGQLGMIIDDSTLFGRVIEKTPEGLSYILGPGQDSLIASQFLDTVDVEIIGNAVN